MGNINSRKGTLFFDFRYQGMRCREYTKLQDIPANRKRMKAMLAKIEAEITLGSFDYAKYFPGSKNVLRAQAMTRAADATGSVQKFASFADEVMPVLEVAWRASHKTTQRQRLELHLKPYFGNMALAQITKAEVLDFRTALSKRPGRNGKDNISPSTINHNISLLNLILAEAEERFDIPNPCERIKSLKVPKTQADPFQFDEVNLILNTVREDYRNYYTVRFFTGMRPAEIDGLKWKYVDFQRREILVRETWVRDHTEYTKNDGSQREISMSEPVYKALQNQQAATGQLGEYVFCTREGTPLTQKNISSRVWYPLLRYLGLRRRNPYQTRHTAATLWLASGENPEWIARQMGHTTTEMLFRVYSRYVPNLTRRDGSAFERLLKSNLQLDKSPGFKQKAATPEEQPA